MRRTLAPGRPWALEPSKIHVPQTCCRVTSRGCEYRDLHAASSEGSKLRARCQTSRHKGAPPTHSAGCFSKASGVDFITAFCVPLTAILVHLFCIVAPRDYYEHRYAMCPVCSCRPHCMANSIRGTLEAAPWNSRRRAPADRQSKSLALFHKSVYDSAWVGMRDAHADLDTWTTTPTRLLKEPASCPCLLDEEIRQLGPPGVVVLDLRSLQHSGTAWLSHCTLGCLAQFGKLYIVEASIRRLTPILSRSCQGHLSTCFLGCGEVTGWLKIASATVAMVGMQQLLGLFLGRPKPFRRRMLKASSFRLLSPWTLAPGP